MRIRNNNAWLLVLSWMFVSVFFLKSSCYLVSGASTRTKYYYDEESSSSSSANNNNNSNSRQRRRRQQQPLHTSTTTTTNQDNNRFQKPTTGRANYQQSQSSYDYYNTGGGDNFHDFYNSASTNEPIDRAELQARAKQFLGTVFPMTRPRDVIQGVSRGLKSSLVGASMGLFSIITTPIMGLVKGGLLGMINYGLFGVIVGAFSTLAGLVSALYQIIVGTLVTPIALVSCHAGKCWNADERKWYYYSLEEEWKKFRNQKGTEEGSRSSRPVKDTTYYDLLGIPTNATPREIKRAYYQKAKDSHPDKNLQNTELAEEQFLQVQVAYQTLSDETRRAAYDAKGKAKDEFAATQQPQFDPYVFFTVLFESQSVEPYIGELSIASILDQLFQMASSNTATAEDLKLLWDESKQIAQKRQLEIAMSLKERVNSYVVGEVDETEFTKAAKIEAATIAHSNFGDQFLVILGSIMTLEAKKYLGGLHQPPTRWPQGWMAAIHKKQRQIQNRYRSTLKTFQVIMASAKDMEQLNQNINNKKGRRRMEEEARIMQQSMENMIPDLLELTWAFIIQDVFATIEGACWRLFADTDTNTDTKSQKQQRIKRAEAILILGNEFLARSSHRDIMQQEQQQQSSSFGDFWDANEAKMQIEIAYTVASTKKKGEDLSSDLETLVKEIRKRNKKARA